MTRTAFALVRPAAGAALLLLLLGTIGCEPGASQSGGREFSDLPESDVTLESVEPPLIAPKPDLAAMRPVEPIASDPELPLRAVKPVFASNLSGLRENLDNRNTPATPAGQPIKLLIPDKSFRPDPQTGSLRISYDDFDLLKILNMEPVPADAVEHFPDWLRSLDGKKVRVRGFM